VGARRALLPIVTLALAAAAPAAAQRYGQWWLDGRIGAEYRSYENRTDGELASRYDQRRYRLSLALNGYIVHPALASFRLELEGILDRYRDGFGLDSDRTGARAEIRLFPEGWYPIRLWVGRTAYSYDTRATPRQGTFLPAIPDTQTVAGGRLRFRRGPLRGTLLGVDRSTLRLVDGRRQRDDREFVDWAPGNGPLGHHYRLEHRVLRYAATPYTLDDWTFNGDEHGDIGRGWRWDMTAVGVRRGFEAAGTTLTTTVTRLANRFTRQTAHRGLLTLGYTAGWTSSDAITSSSHLVEARWERDLGKGVRAGPFAALAYSTGGGRSSSSQRLGGYLTWSGAAGPLDSVVSAQVAAGRFAPPEGPARTSSSLALATTLGHGTEETLRSELELGWTHSTADIAGPEAALPDLGAAVIGSATADSTRARLSLRRRFGRTRAYAYAELRRREGQSLLRVGRSTVEGRTYSAQVDGGRLTLAVLHTEVDSIAGSRQRVEADSVSLGFRPFRALSLHASYRTDVRHLELVPDVDGKQLQAQLTFHLGMLDLRAEFYDSRERLEGDGDRRNRGVVVILSRRFATLLPIVTAPERRGVIR